MEGNDFQLLNFLYNKPLGAFQNISPLLMELYPINDALLGAKENAVRDVNDLLFILRNNGLIDHQPYSIGRGPNIAGVVPNIDAVRWIDAEQIFATILPEGRAFIERNQDRIENEKSRFSALSTEKSVRKTNNLTMLFAVVSTAFVVVTGVKACSDKTEEKIEAITTEMKENRKAFDSINNNLKKLYEAVQASKSDTGR